MRTDDRVWAIDANVILRFVLRDHTDLSPKARTIMVAVMEGGLTVSCDPVVLAEVVWVLTSFYKLPRTEICAALEPIVLCDNVLMPKKDRCLKALRIFGTTTAHFGDACACAAALEDCDGRLLSFDRKLSAVEGITRAESP